MKIFSLIIVLSLLFSSILGCGSRSAKTEYYILNSEIQPANVDVNFQNKIKLYRVNIPSYLDRKSIVLRNINGVTLDINDFYLWAENLEFGIERTLTEALRPELAQYQISLEQKLSGNTISKIQLDIIRFDGTLGGESILEAHWVLSDANGKMLGQDFYYNKIASGPTFDSLVIAQSKLIVMLGQAMALPLSKTFTK